jgi:AcrR family transcriptional regulator
MTNSPQTYHHGDLHGAALSAALELLEQGGMDAVSMRAVASKVGVTHRALYRWFPDREALLLELAATGFQCLAEALSQRTIITDQKTPPFQFTTCYLRFALSRPHLYCLSMSQSRTSLALCPRLKASTTAVIETCQRVLGSQFGARRDDIITLWALLHGLYDLYSNGLIAARDNESFIEYAASLTTSAFLTTNAPIQQD